MPLLSFLFTVLIVLLVASLLIGLAQWIASQISDPPTAQLAAMVVKVFRIVVVVSVAIWLIYALLTMIGVFPGSGWLPPAYPYGRGR